MTGIASSARVSGSQGPRPLVLATDLDRTLTGPDLIPSRAALAKVSALRDSGVNTVLVTGRRLSELRLDLLRDCFQSFVLEGGAMWGRPGDWSIAHAPDALWASAERLVSDGHDVEQGLASFSAVAGLAGHPALADAALSVRRNRDRVDVAPMGIDKGSGLRHVLDVLALKDPFILAVGDSENDIPLLGMADLGIAVGDADDSLQALAHRVAPHPADQGFIWAADQFPEASP